MTAYASPRALDAMSPGQAATSTSSSSTSMKANSDPTDDAVVAADNDRKTTKRIETAAEDSDDSDEQEDAQETAALLDMSKRLAIMASLLEQARNANRLAIEDIRHQVLFVSVFECVLR